MTAETPNNNLLNKAEIYHFPTWTKVCLIPQRLGCLSTVSGTCTFNLSSAILRTEFTPTSWFKMAAWVPAIISTWQSAERTREDMFSPFWDTHHFHLLSLPELNHVTTSICEGSWGIESFSRCPCAWLKIGCIITKEAGENGYSSLCYSTERF